ncbi:MAG: hypothetical protein H0T42_27635 [Deltaproteobacteria bacterium]|nr:hypothetical protein [Deltaproteobacteria bacterium]
MSPSWCASVLTSWVLLGCGLDEPSDVAADDESDLGKADGVVKWHREAAANGAALDQVWGASDGRYFALGNEGKVLQVRDRGRLGTWRARKLTDIHAEIDADAAYETTEISPKRLKAVSGHGEIAVFLAELDAGQNAILELDGEQWSVLWADPQPGPDRGLIALDVTDAGAIYALRADWSLVSFTEGDWRDAEIQIADVGPTFEAGTLWADDGTVLASGTEFYRSGIYRLDDTRWVAEITNQNTESFRALWGLDGFGIAAGNDGVATRANGAWTADDELSTLRSLWGSRKTNVYGVSGVSGDNTFHRFNGYTWKPVVHGVPVAAAARWMAVAGRSASDIVVVGDRGILHYRK